MFDSKESLSTAAECVKVAKEHCKQLSDIGLDLTFTLQSMLVKDVKAALLSYKDVIIEATKHRNSEEMWRRMNLMTPEALAKLKVRSTLGGGGATMRYIAIYCDTYKLPQTGALAGSHGISRDFIVPLARRT